MSEDVFEGGCLCGAVRYRATGAPTDTNLCYCTQCRRQTGSSMPAFASWPRERVEILKGRPASYRASPRAIREFCPDCGSPLFWRPTDGKGLDVFLGTLDEPERLPRPGYQIWARHRLPWVPPLSDIPEHPEGRA